MRRRVLCAPPPAAAGRRGFPCFSSRGGRGRAHGSPRQPCPHSQGRRRPQCARLTGDAQDGRTDGRTPPSAAAAPPACTPASPRGPLSADGTCAGRVAWSRAQGRLSPAPPATSLALRVRGAAFPARMETGARGEGSKLGQAAACEPGRGPRGLPRTYGLGCGPGEGGDRVPKEEECGGPDRLQTERDCASACFFFYLAFFSS